MNKNIHSDSLYIPWMLLHGWITQHQANLSWGECGEGCVGFITAVVDQNDQIISMQHWVWCTWLVHSMQQSKLRPTKFHCKYWTLRNDMTDRTLHVNVVVPNELHCRALRFNYSFYIFFVRTKILRRPSCQVLVVSYIYFHFHHSDTLEMRTSVLLESVPRIHSAQYRFQIHCFVSQNCS